MKDEKHRITLTKQEIDVLAHITRHFCDYMFGDDRPDHGLGILKQYREESRKYKVFDERPKWLQSVTTAMGKLNRMNRKIRQ